MLLRMQDSQIACEEIMLLVWMLGSYYTSSVQGTNTLLNESCFQVANNMNSSDTEYFFLASFWRHLFFILFHALVK